MKKKILAIIIIFLFSIVIYVVIFGGGNTRRTAREKFYEDTTGKGFTIASALKKYNDACKRYPSVEEGLDHLKNDNQDCSYLAEERIKKMNFLDGRGLPLIYISDGKSFKLLSVPDKYYQWSSDGKLFEIIGEN